MLQKNIRRFEPLGVDLFDAIFLSDQRKETEQIDQPGDQDRLADGVFRGVVMFFVLIVYILIHSFTLQTIFIHKQLIIIIL